MQNVIAYVDGFNLYYGLKQKGWRRYYWLNVQRLVQNLLKPDQRLVLTKYFTSWVSSLPANPEKHKRQAAFIEALLTLPDFRIFYGQYQVRPQRCRNCGHVQEVFNEKMTDVNIAVELMTDAFQDAFDTAILISGDSDLTGPVRTVTRLFPGKRVVMAFPPARTSVALSGAASAYFTIGRLKLERSQFPDQVVKPDGFTLQRPPQWR